MIGLLATLLLLDRRDRAQEAPAEAAPTAS